MEAVVPDTLTPFLSSLTETVMETVAREGDLSEEQIDGIIRGVVATGHEHLLDSLKADAPEMLARLRQDNADFRARCQERWREPMDLMWMLWVAAQEVGEAHAHEGPRASDELVFDTMAHLHPKALLITSEIMCLLEGGFADGALARWRSLHEVVVIAMFIAKHGHEVARDYRASIWFENYKAAVTLRSVAERAKMEPHSDEEFAEIEAARDRAEAQIGRRLRREWDWAETAIGRPQVKFIDIERDVGMDHWRPRYKWASQHLHAGFRRPQELLGMSEAQRMMFQIGPSNSGFVDPLHMTAISLMQMTITFLTFGEPNIDRLVFSKIFMALAEDIGETAVRAAKATLDRVRQSGTADNGGEPSE